jgi:protein-tyrosine phosphatase
MEQKVRQAGLGWELDSAGTTNGYHVGEAPHHLSQKVAKLHGIDISRQRARSFTGEDFQQFDRIYAMSADVLEQMKSISRKSYDARKADLLLNELYPGQNRSVPDPWYGPEPGYHEVYRLLDQACDAIIRRYGGASKAQAPAVESGSRS